ncbi:MAG: substrate-binding periplasmic protein [Thermodesulfobacteriota bacterium]
MKRFHVVSSGIVVSSLILLLGFFARGAEPEPRTLIMGWEPWAPFAYRDADNSVTGLDMEIVTRILSSAGYTVEYQEAPWARILKWMEEGKIHIGGSAMKTPEREAYAYFSAPYQRETYLLFVRKGRSPNYPIRHLRDIVTSSFRLGVMRDSLYGAEFVQLMENPRFSSHVEEVTTDEQNYRKLLENRIDGFIQEYSRMATEGKKSGIFDQVEPLLVIEKNWLHVMFSKKATSPEIVRIFNAGLEKMRKDGTYEKLFRKYNLEQYNMIEP